MKVEYSHTAEKQIKKLPKDKQVKVLTTIRKLKNDPYAGKKLKGEFEELRSLKVWPYRIIYRYLPQEKLLFINVIRHRQKAYK
ncbi:type II toxin-antitoxin system RelE/ParE family toxin [Patescibacteria group bacterium]|nr:type II toxin-antitoxin system RelE/ParE family toxin [Patescibacteria group bacterium]MBU0777238.1 type II toxin-antitoxin system RelE/ParE family toxin [Patescibacteria group bacterium]MBU0845933.1 type II toxin-antitoxin system RelE/ParE family toxin [Patescibacteria group bacterium]MBU0922961.1 type II toxin-antitoxin system RelE/ParE family toxin [Patescibacteria group bacterium]MBU1066189.1 type II toxin-antitoxin system RelE/ParE family toxin [Patescibacteria group bacterium]